MFEPVRASPQLLLFTSLRQFAAAADAGIRLMDHKVGHGKNSRGHRQNGAADLAGGLNIGRGIAYKAHPGCGAQPLPRQHYAMAENIPPQLPLITERAEGEKLL